jgi:RNA polymerase sigma-70 factor, ECF subfamily
MAERQLPEPFVHALLECQDALRAYLMALVMDPDEAADLLQETNVVLCRQADEYPTIQNFTAWACRIAYFETLSSRKRRQRNRLLFDDELLALVAHDAHAFVEDITLRRKLLDRCLAELPEAQRALILKRYGPDGAVKSLAEELGRPVGSIQQSLYRIRMSLLECIRGKMEGAKS